MKKKAKIIIVGVYPPPYGGVSNHIKRLLDFLLNHNKDVLLIDTSNIVKNHDHIKNIDRKYVLFYLLKIPASIVHFHGFDLKTLVLIYLVSFKHLTILSLHNDWFLDQMQAKGYITYKIAGILFKKIKKVLVSNKHCMALAKDFIKDVNKIEVIPAFIPPADVPVLEVEQILSLRAAHKYVISSNAFQLDFYKGVDVYGVDILIEMIKNLCYKHNIDSVMIFLLPNTGNGEYFTLLNKRIESYGLKEKFIFITKPVKESSSLWNISDLVIRATNTDGNSLTVLEALSQGVPTIASDCVERPEGTILFKSRNVDDLTDKVKNVLENIEIYKQKLRNFRIENNALKILKVYNDVLKEKNDESE